MESRRFDDDDDEDSLSLEEDAPGANEPDLCVRVYE